MLYYLVTGLYIVVCFVLMGVIYLQQGKGGDIASAFGGGASQAAFGARTGATVLSRAATICAILFIGGALAIGIIGKHAPSSVLGGRSPLAQPSTPLTTSPTKAPVPTGAPSVPAATPAPAAAPATPAPAKK